MESLRENHKELKQETYNIFTEEVNKIAKMQMMIKEYNSIEMYEYGTNEEIMQKKEEIKCINIMKLCKCYRRKHKQA